MKVLLIDKNLVDPINQTKWARFAQRPGIELLGITPKAWNENFRVLRFKPSSSQGFRMIACPVVWPGYENRGFYVRGLGRTMRFFVPDIVLAFEEPFSFFGLQSVIASHRRVPNAKIVLFSWDNTTGGKHYPYRPRLLYRAIERWVMTRVSLLLTANQEAADRFAAMYPVPVRKLYFGIDIEAMSGKAEHLSRERAPGANFEVGYVGRLVPMKGLSDLLEAMSLLSSISLTIVGNGPDLPRLKAMAHDRGLDSCVTFHPAVISTEVTNIIAGLDALVLPSRTTPWWKEQYGRVLIEAMACGTPVIGSTSGAIPEVIGNAGLIFPEGDSVALAECITTLRADPGLHDRLSRAGCERAKLFSAETFAQRLQGILEEAVSGG